MDLSLIRLRLDFAIRLLLIIMQPVSSALACRRNEFESEQIIVVGIYSSLIR